MNILQHTLIFGVRVYRGVISPAKLFLFGSFSGCRFTPTCSEFALEAVATHGALAGTGLAFKRVCRCHPWGGCGHDPVPPTPGKVRIGSSPVTQYAIPNPNTQYSPRP